MYFTENDVIRIKDAAKGRLLDIAQDFHEFRRSGTSYICDCPHCGATRKFSLNPSKEIFGCFSCKEIQGNGALSYLMKVEGKEYLAALEYLADRLNIILDERPQIHSSKVTKFKKAVKQQREKMSTLIVHVCSLHPD